MDINSQSLYIESFQDLKSISNFEEIKKSELIILFPFHLSDRSFVDKNNLIHYNVIILPLEMFVKRGFKTLIINRSTYSINLLASEAKYSGEGPLNEHIITLNDNNQDKYLILKANCHDTMEILDLTQSNNNYYRWKLFLILYYFLVATCMYIYIHN